jgi:hypothetical protein
MTTADRTPTRVEGFLLERLDDEVLLYHPSLARTIRLNETAALVWELCDGMRSAANVVSMLKDAYPDDGREIDEDVARVLERLASEGALVFA